MPPIMDWNFHQLFRFLSFLTWNTIQPSFLLLLPVHNASAINSTIASHFSQEQIYVSVGASLNQHCFIDAETVKLPLKFNCSSLFWEWNGEHWINYNSKSNNECISVLNIKNVSWFGKRNFHCFYKERNYNVEIKSLTVISGDKPRLISKPKLEWIEDKVEVSWLPNNGTNSEKVNYIVQYSCTTYGNITILGKCGYFYNSCGMKTFQCRASFYAMLGATYTTRVIAENNFGKQSSEYAKINISISPPKMMKMMPISKLDISSSRKMVKIQWKDVSPSYEETNMISYKCQGDTLHKKFTNNNEYDILQSTLPIFKYCLFCVSRQRYQNGLFSCPICKKVKTAEGVPQATVQLIPCSLTAACPTVSSSGNFRNVTISWKFPKKKYWNGILILQKVFYHAENDRKLRNFTIMNGSITSWTLGNLKYTERYDVFMVICTLAGCSAPSNSIYIQAVNNNDFEFKLFSDRANSGLFIGVPLAILGACFIIIFVILYLKRREGERLPELREPDMAQLPTLSNEEEYDVLEKNGEETEAL